MHGTGPKLTIERSNDVKKTLKLISDINSYDFISLSTEYARDVIGVNQLVLPKSKIKILGTPKQDVLFDDEYIQKKYNKKNIIKNIFGSKYKNQKIIYYTPTFRDYGSTLPINDISEFNEDDFNKFLTENNLLFLYSYHSMSNFNMGLKETENIRFIDNNENHLFDNIELMTEIDLLVGDYSTLSTDFSILKKPQLFIIPDYKQINDTKGFAEDLRKIMPGKEISTYQDLCINILENINNSHSYLKEFNKNISELSSKYIEDRKLTSCEKFLQFHNNIKKL
jgi:CDP-glycerol glycerophosphotransferase (TagB/SpsB family)